MVKEKILAKVKLMNGKVGYTITDEGNGLHLSIYFDLICKIIHILIMKRISRHKMH